MCLSPVAFWTMEAIGLVAVVYGFYYLRKASREWDVDTMIRYVPRNRDHRSKANRR